ncbi:hypothetical protein ACBJ59_12195 [Nonomuraea sp. MTCD27]|uniref:hypothetical protein n=1 Tax=Nonomuraea sp. MTCD27 TaxID=1676747 RepID=UPI0035C129B5
MHTTITTPGAIIGYRRNGRPIRLIAGGSEGAPEGGTPPPADPPAPPADPPAEPPAQETDWKAMARQWEKRAKDNSKAAEELEKLKASQMTETEKAVAAAKTAGATEAAKTFGARLAAAEFKAAVAAKGLDLGEALDLIDTTRFVDDQGDVDEAEIKKAIAKLAKLAPTGGPGRSGGDFGGGNGSAGTQERPKNLREAYARALK